MPSAPPSPTCARARRIAPPRPQKTLESTFGEALIAGNRNCAIAPRSRLVVRACYPLHSLFLSLQARHTSHTPRARLASTNIAPSRGAASLYPKCCRATLTATNVSAGCSTPAPNKRSRWNSTTHAHHTTTANETRVKDGRRRVIEMQHRILVDAAMTTPQSFVSTRLKRPRSASPTSTNPAPRLSSSQHKNSFLSFLYFYKIQ